MRRRLKLYSWLYTLGWLVVVPVLMTVLLGSFVHFDGGPTATALEPPRERIARLLPPAPRPATAARPGPMLPSPETQIVAVPARFLAAGARPQLVVALPQVRPGTRRVTRRTLRSRARRHSTGLGTQFAEGPFPAGPGGTTSLRSVTPGSAPAAASPPVQTAPSSPGHNSRPAPQGNGDTPAQGNGKGNGNGDGNGNKPAQAPGQAKPKPNQPAPEPASPPPGQGKPDQAKGNGQGKPDHAQGGGHGKPGDPGNNGRPKR